MYNLKELFLKVKGETNNFQNINADFLKRMPESILILRLVCGLTHLKLTEIYKERFDKVVRFNIFERRQKIGDKVGERLSKIFSENMPEKIEFDDIEKKYLQTQQEYVKNRHGDENDLEKIVKRILVDENIPFERTVYIRGKSNVPISADFVIPSLLKPKITIECKISRGFSGHDSFAKARIMSMNSIELGKILYIAVIDGRWSKNSINLLKNYCTIIKKENIKELLDAIQEKT